MTTALRRLAAAVLCAAMLLPLAACGTSRAPQSAGESAEMTVYFFDAGKADAILLTSGEAAVLVDCGEKSFGGTILRKLAELGIEKLDALIITHFDKDHVGGAAKVLGGIAVDRVLQNDRRAEGSEAEKYRRALGKAGIEPLTVTESVDLVFGGMTITVDAPRQSRYGSDDSNNASLIVSVSDGTHTVLLPGDAESERIAEFLASSSAACDVLKLPHHGRMSAGTEALLRAASPAYAVITSSDKEPEDAYLPELLESLGLQVFLTRTAPVTVRCSGGSLEVFYAS